MSRELYNCKYCIYESNKKYNLYRHMIIKHRNKNISIEGSNVRIDNKCIKCNKILSSNI